MRFAARLVFAFFLQVQGIVVGQQNFNTDVNEEYAALKDKHIVQLLFTADQYFFSNKDSVVFFANKVIKEAKAKGLRLEEVIALGMLAESSRLSGDYARSLDLQFQALEICKANQFDKREAVSFGFIGVTYLDLGEYNSALSYLFEAKSRYEKLVKPIRSFEYFNLSNISEAYAGVNNLDSAFSYAKAALDGALGFTHPVLTILCERRLAAIQYRLGHVEEALGLYDRALGRIRKIFSSEKINYSTIKNEVAEIYLNLHRPDSSMLFARQALSLALSIGQEAEILHSTRLLGKLMYQKGVMDSAVYYKDQAFEYQNRLYGPDRLRQVNLIALREQRKQQASLQEQFALRARMRQLILLLSLFFILILAILLYRRAQQRTKANNILQEKNKRINDTLKSLQETQAQLIQREKMASLGELTAGIAHEIQNPLNFVNNFSEVNKELVQELNQEIEKGNYSEAKYIAGDIVKNEEKINEHGKRADAIVKSMLQHSRISSGQKEPININALADEYLRLSYHGMRAKDKSFNAVMKTQFDESLSKITVIPENIGRVLLNLFNNAFSSMMEKAENNGQSYEPTISVTTSKQDGQVLLTVKDNGKGIPDKIKDKIFQPFFTTKPAGGGTGLGLSLSYDIITKEHGGEIKVESKEGEGAVFVVQLPV